MAKAKSAGIPESVRRQLASLTNRVSWLEAALKPDADKTPVDRERAGLARQRAEQQAHREAMQEYREQERLERYRRDPELVKVAIELRRKENAFLRSKGLKPTPSDIPEEFRRSARDLRKRSPLGSGSRKR
jgi:hypothetical protein